jgi:hypothetical protein
MRFFTTISAFLLFASPLTGQQGQGGGPRRFGMALEELQEKLQLDSAQKAKIRPMVAKFEADTKGAREAMRANMEKVRNGQASREEVQAENGMAMMVVTESMSALMKDIRPVLRPDQVKTLDEWIAERQRRMSEMRRPAGY